MSPPVKLRKDYTRDAQALQRIVRAVLADESRPLEWRQTQARLLAGVIDAFNADATRTKRPVVR